MKGDLIILVKHYEFESTLVFFSRNVIYIYIKITWSQWIILDYGFKTEFHGPQNLMSYSPAHVPFVHQSINHIILLCVSSSLSPLDCKYPVQDQVHGG